MPMEKMTWGLTYFDQFIYMYKHTDNRKYKQNIYMYPINMKKILIRDNEGPSFHSGEHCLGTHQELNRLFRLSLTIYLTQLAHFKIHQASSRINMLSSH